jgi:hypothetical protein
MNNSGDVSKNSPSIDRGTRLAATKPDYAFRETTARGLMERMNRELAVPEQ